MNSPQKKDAGLARRIHAETQELRNGLPSAARKLYFNILRLALPALLALLSLFIAYFAYMVLGLVAGLSAVPAVAGVSAALSLRIVWQWEKAVVLRLGKFQRCCGPGVFFIVPVVDTVVDYVDQRMRVTDFAAETTLTRDTVPVYVDAIIFWMVWDPQKAVLEVEHYFNAVSLAAKTALRDIIGRHELAELLTERKMLGERLRETIDERTNPWGITALSIEIKDVHIPEALEKAMSKEAQAERERRSRVLLSTAETEIAEKFAEASKQYAHNPTAMQLRGMNMLYEGLKEKGSLVIVPAAALENMNMGSLAGMTSLAQQEQTRADQPGSEPPEAQSDTDTA
jgi:regulator of protease activity HflC (stomatin/prohibitin superfamily)